MRSEHIWITIAAIANLTMNCVCQIHFINNMNESVLNELHNTQHTENITNAINNDNKINSQKLFGDIIANTMKNFIPFSNVNKNCTRDGELYMNGLNNRKIWAVRMYDSSSKYPGGILSGEINELGYFDQCMSVSSKSVGIFGAYALVNVRFYPSDDNASRPLDLAEIDRKRSKRNPLTAGPENMLWALCFPDSCTNEDIKLSVESVLIPALRSNNIVAEVAVPPPLYTSKNSKTKYTTGFLLIYGIFIVGIVLVVAGTLHDLLTDRSKPENQTMFNKCLYSYSMIANMKDLMENPKNTEFAVSNGLKTLGIITVVIGHRVALDLAIPSHNPEYSEHIFTDFWLSVLKAPVSVEIFFILSGFFTYNTIYERLRSGQPFQLLYLLSYRLARILPTYIAIILIFTFTLPYMGDGPLWKLIVYPEAQFCGKNWWTNILFINNYMHTDEMCMLHAWYLACDMHFFIIGTLLTYVMWRWKNGGIRIFFILFSVSVYLPAKYIYENKQWGVMPYFHSNIKNLRTTEHFQKVYIKSHFRITTYLIGFAAAYIYLRIKKSTIKFTAKNRMIGLAVCLLFHATCYIATGYLYLPELTYNPWHHSLYFTFQRIVYSLTISYILVVGSISNFGFISNFLECKLFTVIARLSYILYLIHFIVQLQSIGEIRQPQYGNFWNLCWKVNGDLTTALVYAIPINLMVEAPSRKIFKLLKNRFIKNEENKSDSGLNDGNNGQTENVILYL